MTMGDMYLVMTFIAFVVGIPTIIWLKRENKKP